MGLLTNPFFQIGMGLVGRSGPSLTPVNPWLGVNEGLMSVQRGRLYEQEAQQTQLQMEQMKREAVQQERLQQWAAGQGDPLIQMFPEQAAKAEFERRTMSPAAPSVWLQSPEGQPVFVTPQEASVLSRQGFTKYETPKDDGPQSAVGKLAADLMAADPSLTPQAALALAEQKTAELRKAGASNVNVQLDKPLTPTELQKLRMPDGSTPPPGSSMGDVAAAGGRVADVPLTEDQSKATMFYHRASNMDQELSASTYNPAGIRGFFDRATAGDPVTNWAASGAGQEYVNQGKNFIAAILRKESGATITPAEWEQGQQLYIPMPGDAPQVIEQKAQNRKLAVETLKVAGQEGIARLPSGQSVTPDFSPRPPADEPVNWSDL